LEKRQSGSTSQQKRAIESFNLNNHKVITNNYMDSAGTPDKKKSANNMGAFAHGAGANIFAALNLSMNSAQNKKRKSHHLNTTTGGG
jgi:hypothetical protein